MYGIGKCKVPLLQQNRVKSSMNFQFTGNFNWTRLNRALLSKKCSIKAAVKLEGYIELLSSRYLHSASLD